MKKVTLLSLLLVALVGAPALAAFVNGVETFDGTVKDTAEWEEYIHAGQGPATFEQNDKLIADAYGVAGEKAAYTDYTSMTGTVADDQTVLASAIVRAVGTYGFVSLGLTNNNNANFTRTLDDAPWMLLHFARAAGAVYVYTSTGMLTEIALAPQAKGPNVYRALNFEIQRTGADSAIFTVRDGVGSVMGSLNVASGLPVFASDPYVSLLTNSARVEWDNVIIPEPVSMVLLAVGGLFLSRRRK